ncbi:unnamed protein product [Allacma fusca]|uniref:Methyltransferase FkbM domain-containing protein n=1 Tax=Allacma fusca TaxID=39272 RepID=A0A8J2JLU8_9HEXA|nr:unnamed protein product [Allacma fusca]
MEKLQNIKTRIFQDLRSAHAALRTDPLLKKLIIIFLLVFLSQLIVLYFDFPSDYPWSPPPLKIPFPSKPSTMQDRFEYSFKDLRAQMNEELITKIEAQINPPPEKSDRYRQLDVRQLPPTKYSEHIDSVFYRVKAILRNKLNGFFIEYGTWGGASETYTSLFESLMNYKGLIIEPDPIVFERLMKVGRNVWTINSGLSLHPNENQRTFIRSSKHGTRIMAEFANDELKGKMHYLDVFNTTCFPLTSILLAINKTSIDLLYLEMKKAALNILKTISWAQFDINVVLVIESHDHNDKTDSLEKYMLRQGFLNRGLIEGPWMNGHVFQNMKYA